MNNLQTSLDRLQRLKEVVFIFFFGWIPQFLLGSKIRYWFYKVLFAEIGQPGYIQEGVDFLGTASIELGNRNFIFRHVRLDARGSNNRLCLKDGVSLERGVDIGGLIQTHIEIGERTFINIYTSITGPGNVTIGQDCLIAPHCGIFANNHTFTDLDRPIREQGGSRKGIVIEDNCWLGHRVTVLDGVTIGKGSVIGAGSVVTEDIPPNSIAVGSPARVIRKREQRQELITQASSQQAMS
jgi:acetyltransferase-like isoleucine patch superfamily enzyme